MKVISKIIAFSIALCFLFSACVMGGGEEDKKDPIDDNDRPDRVETTPEPPDTDAPDIDISVSDTVPIN
ncbi:MAG: hypothetical protein ABFS05_13980 [Bacteroidota bacterium]